MTGKKSCGCNGPASSAPNEGVEDRGIEVVWHDPTQYDPVQHGPPYLPTRLAGNGRVHARRVARSNVDPRVARRLMGGAAPLSAVLSILRAASFLHQTHHWQTRGPSYYADHLLFDRLYTDSQSFIDQVAERAVGLGYADLVDPISQAQRLAEVIGMVARSGSDSEQMVQTSLKMESLVLAVIDEAVGVLQGSDALTNGTDNLLQGVADLHETFVYLLQQRTSNSYDYSRSV